MACCGGSQKRDWSGGRIYDSTRRIACSLYRWLQVQKFRNVAARPSSTYRLLRMYIRRRIAYRHDDSSADRFQSCHRPRRRRMQSQRMHSSLVQERCGMFTSWSIVQLHLYKGMGWARLFHSYLIRRWKRSSRCA